MESKLVQRQQELITGLASELATVVSALLGSNAAAVASATTVAPGGSVNCALSGSLSGSLTLAIGEADAAMLARRLMGMDEDPPEDAVIDTIGEVAGQASGGLSQQPVALGAKIRVDGPARRGAPAVSEPPAVFDVAMEDGTSLRWACWCRLDAEAAVPASPAASQVIAATPAMATLPAAPLASTPATPGLENLDVILDIEMPLTVRFGRTEMTMQALTKIGPGSVIDLDRSPDEPVEVLINETVIARGEVVVVQGNYGVRITEVISPVDRIRSLGN
jgi:flagellar motor switch protein FliN